MTVQFRKSFARDLKKIKDRTLLTRIRRTIEAIETADHLDEVHGIKKLSGGGPFYRIRIGDYRLGLAIEDDTVEFVRCLHRRDIYRYFP